MVADLARILEYVDQIYDVPTEGIDPLIYPINIGNIRELDEPESTCHEDSNQTKSIKTAENFYVVPKVIEP